MDADVEFFWDPVCPFAWLTSRWLVQVAEARELSVDWRFICLRIVNEHRDYEAEFPPGYIGFHTSGQRLLRVAASVRADEGTSAMAPLYTAMGQAIWHCEQVDGDMGRFMAEIGQPEFVAAVLAAAGVGDEHVAALDDDRFDTTLRADTEQALGRTGDDVGTPIITLDPPAGPSFFGPVISRVPDDVVQSLAVWDAITTLAEYGPFTEIKRSLRELPDLPLVRALS